MASQLVLPQSCRGDKVSALDFDRGSCLCGDCRVRRAHRDARSSQTMDERWKAAQTALVYMLAKRKQPDTGAGKALSITAALARRSRDELWTTAGGRPKDSSKAGLGGGRAGHHRVGNLSLSARGSKRRRSRRISPRVHRDCGYKHTAS